MIRQIALMGALCLGVSGVAFARPNDTPAAKSLVAVTVLAHTKDSLQIKVELLHADITQALKLIAARGALQVLVPEGVLGTVSEFSFRGSPEQALRVLCRAANISGEWRNNVWIVSPEPPAPRPIPRILGAMQYRNFDAIGLLACLSYEFNLRVAFATDISQKPLPVLSFENLTPRQAIEVLALAAGAKVTEMKDGTLLLSDNGDAKPVFPAAPPTEVAPQVEEPTSGFILIASHK